MALKESGVEHTEAMIVFSSRKVEYYEVREGTPDLIVAPSTTVRSSPREMEWNINLKWSCHKTKKKGHQCIDAHVRKTALICEKLLYINAYFIYRNEKILVYCSRLHRIKNCDTIITNKQCFRSHSMAKIFWML